MIAVGRMVLVVVLTLVGALPALAQEESSTPEPATIDLRLTIPRNEDVPPQLLATVRDANGNAISGIDVDFTRELRFLGTDRLAPLGSRTTDVGGVARLVVLPRQEHATVVAKVAGTDVSDTIDATFPENRVDTFFDPTHEHGLLTPLRNAMPLIIAGLVAALWVFLIGLAVSTVRRIKHLGDREEGKIA